MKHIWTVYRDN